MTAKIQMLEYYNNLIASGEELIRTGQTVKAENLLKDINASKVPRQYRLPLANLSRRTAGDADLGLRLLYPVINGRGKLEEPATEAEKCEYAALLVWSGLNAEAKNILGSIKKPTISDVTLYKAYAYLDTWDYEVAAEYLEEYIQLDVDPYLRLTAQTNLIASYLMLDQLDKAEALVESLVPVAKIMKATRLLGNLIEFRGQIHFFRGNYAEAQKDLDNGILHRSDGQKSEIFARNMWLDIIHSFAVRSPKAMLEYREEAIRRKMWDSVQEVDFYISKLDFNQARFDYMYFGSTFPGYRRRIRRHFSQQPSSQFVLGNPGGMELDLRSGHMLGVKGLNPGKKIHQVIATLVTDFYMPRSLGSLFVALYPNEVFDISSSPLRIHQLLRRTRRWLETNNIPAVIHQEGGCYRLEITGTFAIRIPLEMDPVDSFQARMARLKDHFPLGKKFSAQQACLKLKMSRSAFHRFADSAISLGMLLRTGTGKLTMHQIVDVKEKRS